MERRCRSGRVRRGLQAGCRRQTAVLQNSRTELDFKTDATVDDQQQYAAQLRLYCAAVSAATGEATRAVLLSV